MPSTATREPLAACKLLQDGSPVAFDCINIDLQRSPTAEDTSVQIDLHLGEQEDEEYRTEDHDWGGLGFIFCAAVLSFHDARPRGASGHLDGYPVDHGKPPVDPRCAVYTDPATVAKVADPVVDEMSGLAMSAQHEGFLWTHNDSGGGPYRG